MNGGYRGDPKEEGNQVGKLHGLIYDIETVISRIHGSNEIDNTRELLLDFYDDTLELRRLLLKENVKEIIKKDYENECVFSWSKTIENDSDRLRKFLMKEYSVGWVKNADIRIDNDRTIFVSAGNRSLKVARDAKEDRVTIDTGDGRTYDFTAKEESGELKVYKNICPELKRKVRIINHISTDLFNRYNIELQHKTTEFTEHSNKLAKMLMDLTFGLLWLTGILVWAALFKDVPSFKYGAMRCDILFWIVVMTLFYIFWYRPYETKTIDTAVKVLPVWLP